MLCAGRAGLAARLLQQVDGWLSQESNQDARLCFDMGPCTAARVQCFNGITGGWDSRLLSKLCPCKAAAVACSQRDTCKQPATHSISWCQMQVRLWAVAAPARHLVSAPEYLQSGFVSPWSLLLHHGWLPACTGAVVSPVH